MNLRVTARISSWKFPISFYLVLAVQNPSEPKRVKYIINGNDEESPPAIYYGGGTQYVYTREQNIEVIKSLGVIKQRAILIVKVRDSSLSYTTF